MGEQFAQQRAILLETDQVHAADAGAARAFGTGQVTANVGRQPFAGLDDLGNLCLLYTSRCV